MDVYFFFRNGIKEREENAESRKVKGVGRVGREWTGGGEGTAYITDVKYHTYDKKISLLSVTFFSSESIGVEVSVQ